MEEPIHSLPESLILECLARLHLKDLPVATRVCRKWLHLIGSRHFYTLRKQLGYTNQVACLLQNCIPSTDDPNFPYHNYRINIFDPMNQEWTRLPIIPNYTKELLRSSSITSFEGKLIVFGNCNPMNRDPVKTMFVLDFATQKWRKGKNMPLIKSYKFSMVASQSHRVFISGELDREKGSVWEYDVWKDEWSVLHQVSDGHIIRLLVIGEELWVIIGYKGTRNWNRFKEHGADVYHLQTEKWRRVELSSEGLEELMCTTDFELYELMKKLCENNLNMVFKECYRLQLGKQSLIMVPISTIKDNCDDDWEELFYLPPGDCYDSGEELFYMQDQDGNLEKIQTFSSDFSGLVGSFCCVEL